MSTEIELQPFTVLIRQKFEHGEVVINHVYASTPLVAQDTALMMVLEADVPADERAEMNDDGLYNLTKDYAIVMVIKGHHYDCSTSG